MTVHRVKTCACGHPIDWHDKSTGRCLYGKDHVMGGCPCQRFSKRRRADAAAPSAPSLGQAIDDAIRALTRLKAALEVAGSTARPSTPTRRNARVTITTVDGRDPPTAIVGVSPKVVRARETANGLELLKLSGAERKILTVLAQHPDGLSKVQIALMTGYSHTSGGFRNNLSALRTSGRLEGDGDRMQITSSGLAELGSFAPLPQGRALLEYWEVNAGGKCERMILGELASVHPRLLSKDAVANRTGYQATSGGFRNALSRLRTLQLIKGRGELGLTSALAGAISS